MNAMESTSGGKHSPEPPPKPLAAWWPRQRLWVKVLVIVFVFGLGFGLGIVRNLTESSRRAPPPQSSSVPTTQSRPAPTAPSPPAPAPESNVAALPGYLAEKDKTVAWLVDWAVVEGDELRIVVNKGWYGLTTEQKVALAAEVLPAVFIVSRSADGIREQDRVVVSILDGDGQLLAVYYGDTGRYRVYR